MPGLKRATPRMSMPGLPCCAVCLYSARSATPRNGMRTRSDLPCQPPPPRTARRLTGNGGCRLMGQEAMCSVHLPEQLVPLASQVVALFLVDLEQFPYPCKLRLKAGELHPHFIVNGSRGVSGVSGGNGVARGVPAFIRGG